jgi:hypothetical protein
MAKGESWEGMHEMTDRQKAQAAIDGIDLYLHHLENLRDLLDEENHGLLDNLAKLPQPLYWRKV